MKKQSGFTLIEVVVTIIILAILAVIALPKFINLKDEAQLSALTRMRGAVLEAMTTANSKLIVRGLQDDPRVCDAASASKDCEDRDTGIPGCDESFCLFEYGYPAADGVTIAHLVSGIAINNSEPENDDFAAFYSVKHGTMVITFSDNVVVEMSGGQVSGHHLKKDRCYITYEAARNPHEKPTLSEPINCGP
ncbi:hypothetical protein VST7929_01482 [Vibrio stylophorae]|uniref:Prepilin-type N-terminal cleavage/methylation domain-containing protein n=1 Tax=Vibrio stylophorae TaxID=659351 RepID=A0ABM8ZUI5_9VIBR|nr:prepilin-type N-terminal cleavage/methylation domain-containing protein [Vibrio stylophorae]CAH0533612.1 hypothetical protein VST7929_01482 [Vibrio stylophorae]